MKNILYFIFVIYTVIHVGGFAVAFNIVSTYPLSHGINKGKGILWLLAGLLIAFSGELLFLEYEYWWVFLLIAILASQYLVLGHLKTKAVVWGSLINTFFVFIAITGYAAWHFKRQYNAEVKACLNTSRCGESGILGEADIKDLPAAVRKYLHYTGAVGLPKVNDFRLRFSGYIRKDTRSGWMSLSSSQYNFMDASTRFFFMHATMKSLPVNGFHCYKNGSAFMDIRLLSLLRVQYQEGREMGRAETVTFFNDMCCMAPATLTDKRIQWLDTAGNVLQAQFTVNHISVKAWLYFNTLGQLVNFVSDDRYANVEGGKMVRMRWFTPLTDYKMINGMRLPGKAKAIYSYPDGDFCYAVFELKDVEYNCRELK